MRDMDAGRAKKILLIQVAVTLGFGGCAFVFSAVVGMSALIGGGTAAVANAMFSYWAFGGDRSQRPAELAIRIYGAEVLKLLVITLLFAATFILVKPLSLGAVIGFFLVIHLLPMVMAIGDGFGPVKDR